VFVIKILPCAKSALCYNFLMKKQICPTLVLSFIILISCSAAECADTTSQNPKTGFQTSQPWSAGLNMPSDVAMTYGPNPDKVKSWADSGYTVWSMFGASWLGKDEEIIKKHPEIVQMLSGDVPFEMIPGRAWVVPTQPWREYIKEIIGRQVAAGAGAILPEEPEFFATTGYSKAFKDEWQKFYGTQWQAPNSSLTAQWNANRLKANLFAEFYRDVFDYTKSLKLNVMCLVPTHSNLNYADWGIVAPHNAFAALPSSDGFIAQVWTGTAKHPHPLGGTPFASVFDYAFLEYSYFNNLLSGTGKASWLLTDPVEDAQGASWADLRSWYEATLTAALMQTEINTYEVSPWPERFLIWASSYGGNPGIPIPQEYASELMTVWSAQRMLPRGNAQFTGGTDGIGFLTADTLMWQRGSGTDRFKGHAAPMLALIKRGVPVNILPVERLLEKTNPFKNIKVIIASFDAWKPENRETAAAVADWVKAGGTLFFLGGTDDYDNIEGSWWKEAGFKTPADALLEMLFPGEKQKAAFKAPPSAAPGFLSESYKRKTLDATSVAPSALKAYSPFASVLPITAYGIAGTEVWFNVGDKPVVWKAACGKGLLIYAGFPGEAVANTAEGEKVFTELIRVAASLSPGFRYEESDKIVVRRGPFVVARSVKGPLTLAGPFADILNPNDPIKESVTIPEKGNAFLLDIRKKAAECQNTAGACLLLAGGNISNVKSAKNTFEFKLHGPAGRTGPVWVYFQGAKAAPKTDIVSVWNANEKVLKLTVPLTPEGTAVRVAY
jgi:hypothetical protein